MDDSSQLAALRAERDIAVRRAEALQAHNDVLLARLASAELAAHDEMASAERLAKRDAALELSLDLLPDVVVIYDEARRIRFINKATTALTGLPTTHFLGKRDEELWPPEVVAHYLPALQEAYQTGQLQQVHAQLELPGQPRRDLGITCMPIVSPDGQVTAVIGITRDTTELHRMDEERRRNQALYVEAARSLPSGSLVVVDGDGRYVIAEGSMLNDLGLGRDAMVGRRPRELFDPERGALVEERFERCLEGRRHRYETCVTGRWVWSEYVPLRDSDDQIIAAMALSMDVTDRHEAADALAQLNAELEQRVARRTTDLEAANAELDSFAYAVSHDLRAPLRAMRGFSQALLEDFGDDLPAEARGYLDQILLGSRRMGDLIDGLLALSRSTRQPPRREWVNLSEVAELCCRELAATCPGHPMAWSVTPDLCCDGDSAMLGAAVQNLLDNAWKYTVGTPEPAVAVTGAMDAHGLHLTVRDNGAGFHPDHAAKLFQAFQRLHRQDEFPGIGIGLATVQRIVRRHGGTIDAVGEPGRGAAFTLHLPAVPRES